jgi:hypothetical protein
MLRDERAMPAFYVVHRLLRRHVTDGLSPSVLDLEVPAAFRPIGRRRAPTRAENEDSDDEPQ